jgi:hypothetical protein
MSKFNYAMNYDTGMVHIESSGNILCGANIIITLDTDRTVDCPKCIEILFKKFKLGV